MKIYISKSDNNPQSFTTKAKSELPIPMLITYSRNEPIRELYCTQYITQVHFWHLLVLTKQLNNHYTNDCYFYKW